MISAIVLAAGLARRFGSAAKPLAIYNGKSLVRHVVDALDSRDVQDVIVVVPRPEVRYEQALSHTRARVVINEQPAEGMSSSLRVGLNALETGTDAVLIALGDQPTIERSVVERLIREWHRSRAAIVAPLYRKERGHPVLFEKSVFPELQAVRGDQGAREVIDREPDRVCLVTLDRDVPPDVDTLEDLDALQRQGKER